MSNKTRIMVCDDSAVMRRILKTVLSEDNELEVVYCAQHGRDALDHLDEHRPDIVVLDVEMPVMDGIETVAALRQRQPKLPIIMFSSLTSHGAEATLDALNAGASDFATKPSGVGHVDGALETVRRDLIAKIKSLSPRRTLGRETSRVTLSSVVSRPTKRSVPAEILAIGVSTGGPKALNTMLSQLPADFPVPILIVQHMPAAFTGMLAERLDTVCRLKVREASDNEIVRPGTVWIAKGDYHMELTRIGTDLRLRLNENERENSVRPAVDPLFRSVAHYYRNAALGVVLTGMGKDGLEGSRAMRATGGQIIVQDEATSAVWGMPRQVAEAGLADGVFPIEQMTFEVLNRIRRSPAALTVR